MNMEAVMLCYQWCLGTSFASLYDMSCYIAILRFMSIDSWTSGPAKITGPAALRLFHHLQVYQMVYSPSGNSLWVATGGNPGNEWNFWTPVLNSTDCS